MSVLPDADFLHRLADIADAETLPRYRQPLDIEAKERPGWTFDPVTEADRSAEVALRAAISATHPDHAILGEEYGETGSGSCRWVLDPVDGTRPFICGIPVWSTLIGFTVEGRARMGMMSQPFTGERFWATPDGAWGERAGKRYPLRTRKVSDLSQAILHTTSPEHYDGALKHGLDRLTAAVRMIRFGGESYAVAMLAAGHIDLCLEPALQPFDIVALIPIIEQAGGVVTRPDGGRPESGGAILASATPELHVQALNAIAAGAADLYSIPAHPPDRGPHLAAMIDDHTIETIAQWAHHEPLVLEIWVFGSRVSGQTKEGSPIRPDSDLDIAIRLKAPPSGDLAELQAVWSEFKSRAQASLSLRLPWRLDFQLLEGGRSPCLESYVSDCSRLIYRR